VIYSELQNAVADWLNRADLTSVIPTFVQLTEARLQRRLKSRSTTTVPVVLAQGEGTVALPLGIIDVQSVTITTPSKQGAIDIAAYAAVESHRQRNPMAGTPRLGAVVGTTLHVAPLADQAYDLAVECQLPFTPLLLAADSNWILAAHPDAYLFGALAESAPYLKDDERVALWEGRFQTALEEIDAARERTLWPAPLVRPMPNTFAF
jgi:hypothetical protein